MGRRIRQLTLLAFAAGLLWVVAPALSTTPYLPPAVDFEQSLSGVEAMPTPAAKQSTSARPGHAHEGEGPVTHRSGVIEAPDRFDLVGLARERRPHEIRVREQEGEWSEWVELANGDPLYVGGADELQLRTRGWRPQGTLHYVNVSGTTSDAATALTRMRQAVSSAFISASGLVAPAADAADGKPKFVSRQGWGANRDEGGCKPRQRASYGKVKAVAIHHTVNANTYSSSQARGIVLGICRFHRNANGWDDIGYNALVDRFGTLYEGRKGGLARPVIGAHAQGYNSTTAGIAAIGTHSSSPPSGPAITGFARYLAWKLKTHDLPATGKTTVISRGGEVNRYPEGERVRINHIFQHGKVDHTSCPGDRLRDLLPRLRDKTARRMRG